MKDPAICPMVLVLAVLTGGCGIGPQTTGSSPKPASVAPLAIPVPEDSLTNSIGMTLVEIPAGEFMMGSPDSDSDAVSNEKPQHRIRITKPFYLGATEVTQAQYEKVMGENPSHFIKEWAAMHPVETVSWAAAQEFCQKLSGLREEKEAGRRYRLPTEAQWEYACRAGSAEKFCYGDDESRLGDYAWYSKNSDGNTHPVGQKKPNAWGLYDMHGNVWEWCADRYSSGYYAKSPMDDPVGPAAGSGRVSRGGGGYKVAGLCRSAFRNMSPRGFRNWGSAALGLRVLVRVDK